MSGKTRSLEDEVRELGPWFHQIDLGDGVFTRSIHPSPGPQPLDHPLPRWHKIRDALPADMRGLHVLDVGCSDGFFSFEMARRGARVLAVDAMPSAIKRLRWARAQLQVPNVETKCCNIYRFDRGVTRFDRLRYWLLRKLWLARWLLTLGRTAPWAYEPRQFDLVFMFALLYHMPEPLLALTRVAPLADVLLIETLAVDDEIKSALIYQPPREGVNDIPKWYPTTRCLRDMLKWVGYDEVMEIAGPDDNRPIYIAWKRGADLSRWNLPARHGMAA